MVSIAIAIPHFSCIFECMTLKTYILTVVFLVSMQSCIVYQKTSVTLADAHDKGVVKVESYTGELHWFENIELRDSTYYGLSIKRIENKYGLYEVQYYIPLSAEQLNKIYLKDRKKSKRQTILLATSPLIIIGSYVALIIILIWFGVFSIA